MTGTLDGQFVFGLTVSMVTADNPRGHQQNAYPGLSGIESLDQGLRGRFTTVTGRLWGYNGAGLAAAEETLRAYNDGLTHVLVDTLGRAWPYVKLETFEPQGRIQILAGSGLVTREYVARFLHL
jgi:hypothetical protein